MHAHSLADVWHQVGAAQAAPGNLVVWGTAVAALVAVGPRPLWHRTRNVVTIAHEGGHALMSVLMRRRLHSIRLHSDTSGLTVSSGKPHGPGMVLTGAAGYTAPSLLGLLGAGVITTGHVAALLWGVVALLLAVLVMVRNAFGVLTVLLTGALCFAVTWYGSDRLQGVFGYLAVWFLLLGGVRPVLELHAKRRRRERDRNSDADLLGRLTHTPAGLWLLLFLLVSLGALALGARWLLTA